eukprot:s4531_g3.t1
MKQEQTRHMFFLDEVIQSDEIRPDEVKKTLNERGLEATTTDKQLLRVLQSLSSTWTLEDKVEESERNDSKKNEIERFERLKNQKKGEAMKAIQPGEEESNEISERPNNKQITRRLSWRLPSSSSLASVAGGHEEGNASAVLGLFNVNDQTNPHAQSFKDQSIGRSDTFAVACQENQTASIVEAATTEDPGSPLMSNEDRLSAPVEVTREPEVPSKETVKKTEQVSGDATAMGLGRQQSHDAPSEDKESLGAQNPGVVLNSEEQRVPITDAMAQITERDRQPPTVNFAGQMQRDASDGPEPPRLEQDLEDGSETSSLTKPEATPSSRPDEPAEWERQVVVNDESLEEVLEDAVTSPKPPQVEERRVVFDEGLEEVLEDAVTSPKPPQVEAPTEPREANAPEMHIMYHDEAETPRVASRRPATKAKEKKLKAKNSITSWMQEVSRALLAHSEVSSEPREELEKQLTASASLQFLLNRRKRRRGLPTSLWPELSVGNSSSARKDFSASQPLRTKTGRLPRSDTPEMQPGSIHAILESASPASAVRGRSPTGRLRKRSLKANFAGTPLALDVGQGKAPKLTSSPRVSPGKLCRGAMSHFRDELPTRSFHGSGNGLKLAVAPGLEAFLWGHTRPRGEWRGLLQTTSKETAAFDGVEELVVKHSTKEKPTKLLQRRRLMQLFQAVEAKVANKKLAAANRFESDFTLLPARSSESRQMAFREEVLETARNVA